MTITLEVGAQINGEWVTSPAQLRGALVNDASDVEFWPVSAFTQGMGQHFLGSDPRLFGAHSPFRLRVSGPNPFLGWKWRVLLEPRYFYKTDRWMLVDPLVAKPSHGLAA